MISSEKSMLPTATPTLHIFGAGGFGREVAWLARQCKPSPMNIVFLVDDPIHTGVGSVGGIPIQTANAITLGTHSEFVVAVGEPSLKRRAAKLLESLGYHPTNLTHPSVEMSDSVSLGPGTVVCAGSILTVDIQIGAHVHINLNSTIGHDVTVGDFTTICPGANISGNVQIGRDVFIGTGVSIINGNRQQPIAIGDGAIIAAGSCVTKSVEANSMVAGVPALRKR